MASPRSFSVEEAKTSLQRHGFYTLKDSFLGSQVSQIRSSRFPLLSPTGVDFLAQASLKRKDVYAVLESMLGSPHWGLIKVYSEALPSDYAYCFHNAPSVIGLGVQLWSPKSKVIFYDGSLQYKGSVDEEVSKKRGLLATRRDHMPRESISENLIEMEEGGISLSDSRLKFTILQGYVIYIGFATPAEIKEWGPMKLTYSQELQAKIGKLQGEGFNVNYAWY